MYMYKWNEKNVSYLECTFFLFLNFLININVYFSGGVRVLPGVWAQEGTFQRLLGRGEARQTAGARAAARRDRDPVLRHDYQP